MALKSNIHCCVPLYTQRECVGPKGEQIGFFKFPDEEEMKKRWIHAIHRDVGRFFCISGTSKVCSLHLKLSEVVNDIPETDTNKTIILGATSTSLDEMPATEKDLN